MDLERVDQFLKRLDQKYGPLEWRSETSNLEKKTEDKPCKS